MADKIVAIKFEVNSADAVEDINKVTKATDGVTAASSDYEDQLNDTKKATDSFKGSSKQFEDQLKSNSKATEAASLASNSFEEQLKEIKKTIDGANVDELEDAIKQYKNIAIIAGQTSPIGREAIMEASALKDKIEDLETAVSIAQRSGTQLQGALQLGSGIAAGYGAVQGVMALVGSESEDLQKTLVKLQAVQATLASVEEIRAVLQKESAFMITATTVAEKARAAATAVSTFVTNGATLSLKLFRGALIGTGIGAIVVLLIAAADAMGLFGDSTDKATLSAEGLNKELDKQNELTKRLNTQIDRNLEKQVLKAKIAGQSEEQISKLQIDAQNLRTKNLEDFALKTLRIESLIVKNTKSTEEEKIEAKKKTLEAYKAVDDAIQKQNILNLSNQLIIADKAREKEKEAADKAREIQKEKDAEFRRKRQENEKNIADIIKQGDEEIEKVREEKQKKKEELEKKESERLVKLQKEEEEFNKWKEAEEQRVIDTKINLALMGFNIINELAALSGNKSEAAMKRAFEINKAFQIAQAINEGYRGVLKAYAEAPPGFKIASAVLAGTFAAVQVAKISQSKFNTTSFNNNKPADVPLTSAAPTQTQAPQTPGRVSNLTGNQTTTVKAIVVESDITTTQKRINSIQELAKI